MSAITEDYKLYLDERFKSLATSMNAQFTVVQGTLDEIKDHVQLTNGRVSELEKETSEIQLDLKDHALTCPKGAVIEEIKAELEDYRFIRRYPKLSFMIIAFIVGGVLLSIVSFFRSSHESTLTEEMLKEMKQIRTEVQTMDNSAPRPAPSR